MADQVNYKNMSDEELLALAGNNKTRPLAHLPDEELLKIAAGKESQTAELPKAIKETAGQVGDFGIGMAKDLGNAVLKGFERVDRVPVRAAENAWLNGAGFSGSLQEGLKHLGSPIESVPSDLEIVHKMGVSNKPILDPQKAEQIKSGLKDSLTTENSMADEGGAAAAYAIADMLQKVPRDQAAAFLNSIPGVSMLVTAAGKGAGTIGRLAGLGSETANGVAATAKTAEIAKEADAFVNAAKAAQSGNGLINKIQFDKIKSLMGEKVGELISLGSKTTAGGALYNTAGNVIEDVKGERHGNIADDIINGLTAAGGAFASPYILKGMLASGKIAAPYVRAMAGGEGALTAQALTRAVITANSPEGKKITEQFLNGVDKMEVPAMQKRQQQMRK